MTPDNAEPTHVQQAEHMPSNVDEAGFFDKFAEAASSFFAKPRFFTVCVAIVLLWAASFPLHHSTIKWELLIHTVTGIITFLMVALLQNSEVRSDRAAQAKLNAIAAALAELMTAQSEDSPRLRGAVEELRESVGLESVEN